jgi:hypothetical protein
MNKEKSYPLTLRGKSARWEIMKDFFDYDKAMKFAKKIDGVAYSCVDTSEKGCTYYREGSGHSFVNRLHHWIVVKKKLDKVI